MRARFAVRRHRRRLRRRLSPPPLLLALAAAPARAQDETSTCAAKSPVQLLPKNPKLCADLAAVIRDPGGAAAGRVRGQAGRLPPQLLPPRRGRRLAARQAGARHRPLHRHPERRAVVGQGVRHPRAGGHLVLAGDARLAGEEPAGGRAAAGRAGAGAGGGGDGQGDVPGAGGVLRRDRPDLSAADQRRGGDGARRRGLVRRLVLGLVRVERLEPRLPHRPQEPLPLHGLRAVLHQLPRLGARQPHLRQPAQRRGDARPAAGLPEPALLQPGARPQPPRPGRLHRRRPAADRRAVRPPQPGAARPPAGAAPGRGGLGEGLPAAVGDLRQRLAGRPARRPRPGSSSPPTSASAATTPAAPACSST